MGRGNGLRVNYVGLLRSPVSWANVNREMILGLDRLGCDVSVTPCRGFLYDKDFPLPPRLEALLTKPRHSGFELAFEYPPNYFRLRGQQKLGLLVYETSPLPTSWVQAIQRYLHGLIVPTRFCRHIVLESGIPETMVYIVPYGIDPEQFSPTAPHLPLPTEKTFKFLHVAAPHKRKGTEYLLEDYVQEFDCDEDVVLIVKSTYRPRKDKALPWETAGVEESVQKAKSFKKNPPEICVLIEAEPQESMPGYYAACDCSVQPSSSEGFGLAILEAMACGKPAVVLGWGGHMDFCDSENAYIVPYHFVPAGEVQYDNDSSSAQIAVPQGGELRRAMRRAFEDREKRLKKGKKALFTAQQWSWDLAAAKVIDILRTMNEGSEK